MIRVKKYSKEDFLVWNEFVKTAKNYHFFFDRNYMEYHKDRFKDFSLLFYNDKNVLLAVLPASKNETGVISHGGLTFGGFIINSKMTVEIMLEIFVEMKAFLKGNNITTLIYKCMPFIYSDYPSEEDKYALFINEAKLIRRDVSTAIYLPTKYKFQERRLRAVKKAKKLNINIVESKNYDGYIDLLNNVLKKYHNSIAVHTACELKRLADKFPENIKLYIAEKNDEILAGTVIFENKHVAHTQYLANSDEGRKCGALDYIINYLVTEVYFNNKWYFDFGISNENNGRYLNSGLIEQKEGFGARAVVHDFYKIEL